MMEYWRCVMMKRQVRGAVTPGLQHSTTPYLQSPMFSEQIELRGHIIDSLILPKVLDEILTGGGAFTIREIKIGKQRHDASYACIDVFGPSPEVVDDIVRRLRPHGAEVVEQSDARLVPAPADGEFPADFYVTTNQQTFVHCK